MTNQPCLRNTLLGSLLVLVLAVQGGTLWQSAQSLRHNAPILAAEQDAFGVTRLSVDSVRPYIAH